MNDATPTTAMLPAGQRRRFFAGLSARLLALTLIFVMAAQILIFVPTVANFRKAWLEDRLAAAQVAVMVLEATPREGLPAGLEAQLLDGVGAMAIAARAGGVRRLLSHDNLPSEVGRTVDLRESDRVALITDTFDILINGAEPLIRVVGKAMGEADFVEIIIDERPLRQAMLVFTRNIFLVSLAIAALSAALVYFALHWIIVRPVKRLARNVMAFAAEPEDPARRIRPSGRADEIGEAEEALAGMEAALATALRERKRLAAVGLAVSKINHDLRNMLASAQLISDRIAAVPDPAAQRFAPKLIATLNRAIEFCQSTLAYGRAIEPPPRMRPVGLAALVAEVGELLGLDGEGRPRLAVDMPRDLHVLADPDQLFRVLSNLMRNSVQALSAASAAPRDPEIRVEARTGEGVSVIRIIDNGPGVPARARANLFEAFRGSAKAGGTGLGLAIAAELIAAHGGRITLEDSEVGAVFRITLPEHAER